MADITPVNGQITDAVTQTNVMVLGEAPAHSLALAYQGAAHSLTLAMQNAQQAQAGMQQIGVAVASAAAARLLNALS